VRDAWYRGNVVQCGYCQPGEGESCGLAFARACDSRAEYTHTRSVDAYRDQSTLGVRVYRTACNQFLRSKCT